MTSLDKYLEIIKKGFSERENLMAMEPLHSIEEIAPLLDEKLTYNEFIDINRLLRQKYIVENPEIYQFRQRRNVFIGQSISLRRCHITVTIYDSEAAGSRTGTVYKCTIFLADIARITSGDLCISGA